jgi:hypothetical protein
MNGLDHGVGFRGQKAVDQMRSRNWFGFGATFALVRGPEAGEREQRPLNAERKPDDVFLFGDRIGLGRIFRKARGRHQTAMLGF